MPNELQDFPFDAVVVGFCIFFKLYSLYLSSSNYNKLVGLWNVDWLTLDHVVWLNA